MTLEKEPQPNREVIISFVGEINETSTKEFMERFTKALQSKPKEIRINITSGGGSIDHAIAIHDLIRTSEILTTTTVFGTCDSAAVLVLQASRKRQIGKNGKIILHPIFQETKGPLEEVEFSLKGSKIAQEKIIAIIAERSGKTIDEIRGFYTVAGQRAFSAEEALEFGLVDETI